MFDENAFSTSSFSVDSFDFGQLISDAVEHFNSAYRDARQLYQTKGLREIFKIIHILALSGVLDE